jgi:S1-C subfamily serine protease
VIGQSRNYDLLYFRVGGSLTPPTVAPSVGERVLAYGQGAHGEVRVAAGIVRALNVPVKARCETCAIQSAFIYEGNAGPGFSGGPVVDADTGQIVGITFGYLDPDGRRLMYAYPMSRVRNELATIEGRVPTDVN